MREAACIEIAATPAARLDYLLRDYAYLGDDRAGLAEKMGALKELQGKETVARWQQWAHEADLPRLFAELMSLHYDPHYEASQARHFKAWARRRPVAAADLTDAGIDAAAEAVLALASAPDAQSSDAPSPGSPSA
jgi:tRNA 2-selenouridine synthase